MNYAPRGLYVWDAWYMPLGDEVHCYHLQRSRAGADIDPTLQDHLGHCVSRDLINWEDRGPAFGPDPSNPDDDRQPWTGCAFWHQGQGYLYYTMRGSRHDLMDQSIGLATTNDPDRWHRHPANPVIRPDPRWYATMEGPVPGRLDCRDLAVIPDPKGGWLGYYATRQPGDELPETACIACVHSDDLIHWQHRPPAFAPSGYAVVEVPEVFFMDGRWYMICVTGHWYGSRGIWHDPNLVAGTMFAVADDPEGPFEAFTDSAVVAARTTAPLCCRTLVFESERHVLYTDRERIGRTDGGDMTWGTLATPKLLGTDADGRLHARWSPRTELLVDRELIGPQRPPVEITERIYGQNWQMPTARWERGGTIRGSARTGWGMMHFDCAAESFIYEAEVIIDHGIAGLGLRMIGHLDGAVVAMDVERQEVGFYHLPSFDWSEVRQTPIRRGEPVHLRVVQRLEHVEIYVDDSLRLAFSRYQGIGGDVGLFVDRGSARFDHIRFRTLEITAPER